MKLTRSERQWVKQKKAAVIRDYLRSMDMRCDPMDGYKIWDTWKFIEMIERLDKGA